MRGTPSRVSKKQSYFRCRKPPGAVFRHTIIYQSIWLFTCLWCIFHFVPNLWIDVWCLKLILDSSSTWYWTQEFASSAWYLETDFDVLWLPNDWIKRFALLPALQYFKMRQDDPWERFSICQCINHPFFKIYLVLNATLKWNEIDAFNSLTKTCFPWAAEQVSERASERMNDRRVVCRASKWVRSASEGACQWANGPIFYGPISWLFYPTYACSLALKCARLH